MTPVQYIEVPIDTLRQNSFNPNKVSTDNERKIRESIIRNGLFRPIIVREVVNVSGYEIIGGEHRWEQAKELGHKTIHIANLGFIDDKKAKEIGVLDNARYGTDDTLMLSDILREIGDADEIQSFLPYGETDLGAIFSATNIDLDLLSVVRDIEKPSEDVDLETTKTKPGKTHDIMRFKIGLIDAERITALIAKTQREQGFKNADELTNAGDALVYLLINSGQISTAGVTQTSTDNWNQALNEIEESQKESKDE